MTISEVVGGIRPIWELIGGIVPILEVVGGIRSILKSMFYFDTIIPPSPQKWSFLLHPRGGIMVTFTVIIFLLLKKLTDF